MKRKSFLAIMVLMLAIVLLTACNKDGKHNFAEEWSNNETHHWHACTDKGCKETKDKAEHTWDGGNVTVEPTTEQKGTMVYTCTVCRREKTESINELVVGTEYTITFDSKGGSAVQPIKASAGAAITAPTDPTKDGFVLQAGMKARTAARRFPTRHSVFHICRQEFSRFTQNGRLPTLRARHSKKLTQSSSGSPKPSSKRFLQKWK